MIWPWDVIDITEAPGDGVTKVRKLALVAVVVDNKGFLECRKAASLSRRRRWPSCSSSLPCWRSPEDGAARVWLNATERITSCPRSGNRMIARE